MPANHASHLSSRFSRSVSALQHAILETENKEQKVSVLHQPLYVTVDRIAVPCVRTFLEASPAGASENGEYVWFIGSL